DTAAMYANEAAVGAAIAASGLPRDEIFVTTKVWHDQLAPQAVPQALEQSLAKLKLDYADLYLVHWPAPGMDMAATMDAMVALRESGRVRAIGVCN
ncbi:aldo/keto reductase, partial [Acinetobacter baumannii]